jgi:cellulose biosynthesis protein BcsQ
MDDLARLALQTGFDRSVYKTFRTARHKLPSVAVTDPEIASTCDETPEPPSFSEQRRAIHRESDASEFLAQALPLNNLARFSRGERWAGLELAFGSLVQNIQLNSVEQRRAQTPSLSVSGVVSGVGTTTVVASLARLWSRSGEQVLILDASADPLLPLFFGARTTTLPVSSFVFAGDPSCGAIHTLHRHTGDLHRTTDTAIAHYFDSLKEQGDRFLVDAGAGTVDHASNATAGDSIHIFTLVPDTRGLAALARDESRFSTPDAGGVPTPLLLLNQFDATDSMHLEIRARLVSRFPGRLVPVEIRRDRQVPAALGAGTTVIDYAPASNATQDFMRLSQWLANGTVHDPAGELSHVAGASGK